jgi:hypothetical protein
LCRGQRHGQELGSARCSRTYCCWVLMVRASLRVSSHMQTHQVDDERQCQIQPWVHAARMHGRIHVQQHPAGSAGRRAGCHQVELEGKACHVRVSCRPPANAVLTPASLHNHRRRQRTSLLGWLLATATAVPPGSAAGCRVPRRARHPIIGEPRVRWRRGRGHDCGTQRRTRRALRMPKPAWIAQKCTHGTKTSLSGFHPATRAIC